MLRKHWQNTATRVDCPATGRLLIDLSRNNIYKKRAEGPRDGAYTMIVKLLAKATFRDDRTFSSNKHFLQFQSSIHPE